MRDLNKNCAYLVRKKIKCGGDRYDMLNVIQIEINKRARRTSDVDII